MGSAAFDVYVQVVVPAMGWTTLFYQANTQSTESHRHTRSHEGNQGEAKMVGQQVKAGPVQRWELIFNADSHMLEGVNDSLTAQFYPLKQEFLYYRSMQDNGQDSGAYIFRPAEQFARSAMGNVVNNYTTDTSIITVVNQQISPWISQSIRLSTVSDFIEFEWTIGPIDVSDLQGKEVITRFTTGHREQSDLVHRQQCPRVPTAHTQLPRHVAIGKPQNPRQVRPQTHLHSLPCPRHCPEC